MTDLYGSAPASRAVGEGLPHSQPRPHSSSGPYSGPGANPQPGPSSSPGPHPQPGPYAQGAPGPQGGPYAFPVGQPNNQPQPAVSPQSGTYPQSGPYPARAAYPQGRYPGPATYAPAYGRPSRGQNPLAIAGFVAAVLGVPIAPLIMGHLALVQIKRTGEEGMPFAIVALVLGYLQLVGILAFLGLVAIIAASGI